ncbi:hypothetical protein HX001_17165 [Empedobacter brevis]|uniref:Uncharacterized protein n=1 Tax=Empedobacter brevis TaxID=247 RepID=A0AAJ1QHN6_9FLAO|nr:hypothetical protein [Empedobacter brevis]MDM1074218.1 hypothetical protein [Empedobacter brevis]
MGGIKRIKSLVCMQTFQKNHLNDFGYFALKARYELFLNKDVEIGMFVPVDEKENVLNKPNSRKSFYQFNKAKERVLFEDWTYDFEDEYLVFKIGDETGELFLDFEEIEGFKLIDLVNECFPLSKTALNEIYEES